MDDEFIYTEGEIEDEVCNKVNVVKFSSIAVPVFFSVVIALSLVGNILVLVILAMYENLKSHTNIFILNLAMSDLVFTAGLPFWAIYHIWGWIFDGITCQVVNFVFFVGFYSSLLFLTIMTIHRYMSVVHPLFGHGTQRGCYGATISMTIWMVSFGAAIPSLLFTSVTDIYHQEGRSLGCDFTDPLWKKVGTYQQNIFSLAAFAVMGYCYVQILKTILRARSHTRNRTVKLIFIIVAVFFLGWVPYNVVILLRLKLDETSPALNDCKASIMLDYGFYVCRLIAFSHCCLNPLFYVFIGVKFRNHLKRILLKLFKRQSPQQNRMSNVHSMGSMY
ncbi:chemokine (C motif) receptor 1a, duplicate 1 [Aplochiton taeniatus]